MNPFALVALAIVGVLAIGIYLSASSKSNQNIEISRQKHELESMKFDRDFSDFNQQKPLSKPTDEDIQKQQAIIAKSEERKRLIELEEDQRRAEMQKSIDELAGYKQDEN